MMNGESERLWFQLVWSRHLLARSRQLKHCRHQFPENLYPFPSASQTVIIILLPRLLELPSCSESPAFAHYQLNITVTASVVFESSLYNVNILVLQLRILNSLYSQADYWIQNAIKLPTLQAGLSRVLDVTFNNGRVLSLRSRPYGARQLHTASGEFIGVGALKIYCKKKKKFSYPGAISCLSLFTNKKHMTSRKCCSGVLVRFLLLLEVNRSCGHSISWTCAIKSKRNQDKPYLT